jgi:hypothetical protein
MIGGHLFKCAERCSYKLHMMAIFHHFQRVSCVLSELLRRQDCVITEDAELLRLQLTATLARNVIWGV